MRVVMRVVGPQPALTRQLADPTVRRPETATVGPCGGAGLRQAQAGRPRG